MVGYFADVEFATNYTDYGFIVFAFSYLGVGQFGSPPRLGRGSRGFKSLHPDQTKLQNPWRRELAPTTVGWHDGLVCFRLPQVKLNKSRARVAVV